MRTAASTVGERWPLLTMRSVEAVKWTAFALMLIEHVHRYALGTFPAWVYLIGRSVFPLFAMTLAMSLAGKWTSGAPKRTLGRLVIWGALSVGATMTAHEGFPLNVMLTLALGVALYQCALRGGWLNVALGAVLIAAGALCEFGPFGVCAVALCCSWAQNGSGRRLVGAMACICASQLTLAPLLAVPLAWTITSLGIELPRVRHAFYWAYAAQWPVIRALKELLA